MESLYIIVHKGMRMPISGEFYTDLQAARDHAAELDNAVMQPGCFAVCELKEVK